MRHNFLEFTIWKWESTNYLCSDIFLDEIKRMSLCFFLANLLTDFFSIQGYIRVSDQCFKSLVIKSSTMHQNDLQFKTDVNNTIHTYTCESSELSWYLPFHFSTLEQFEVIFCRISFAKFLTSNIKTLHGHIRYFLKCNPTNNLTDGDLIMRLSIVGAFGSRTDSCKWS